MSYRPYLSGALDKNSTHPYTVVNDYENDTGIAFNGRENVWRPSHFT
jgi:hypothetical protein